MLIPLTMKNTKTLKAQVTPATSLFNFTLFNSSYILNNQPFVPSYNYSFATDLRLQTNAQTICQQLLNGSFAASCTSFFSSYTFYDACMGDVAVSTYLLRAEPSIVACSELCYYYNSSFGINPSL